MESNEIISSSKDISLTGKKSVDFCAVWPGAKKALELLRDIIKNPIAKGAISVVIAAGEAVSKEICK